MAPGNESKMQTIAICSHRGGSMKTTIAALVARYLAGEGMRVVLADGVVAGGAFTLGSPRLEPQQKVSFGGPEPLAIRRYTQLKLTLVHLPDMANNRDALRQLKRHASQNGTDVLVLDLPTCGRSELGAVLSEADLAIVALPSDGIAIRSLLPFLRDVQEIRSMPGRRFRTVVVPTGTGLRTNEQFQLDRFIQEILSPLLCGATVPSDTQLGRAIANAEFPDDLMKGTQLESHVRLLGATVAQLLTEAANP